MDNSAQESYLQTLKQRIAEGFYYSDSVMTKLVDELAPVMADAAQND